MYICTANQIGKRFLFGLTVGSITGLSFGVVNVMRDSNAIRQKSSVSTNILLQHAGKFGGFFASYHGIRKVLKLYVDQTPEMNVATAAVLCTTPLVVMSSLRPMMPYAIMMIGLDAINGIHDI